MAPPAIRSSDAFALMLQATSPCEPWMFDINSYLKKRNNKTGNCRVCSKQVPWVRDRVSSHKTSGNCTGISPEELEIFRGLKRRRRRTAGW
ncbi:hypothetical protein PHMEG_00022695 [Phytophthora megakarya]|uniref:Uncharacterized protein n=1 Tax=Phytophthora megakarya TaxID=4795 RepID=A0A225VI13_9STRA|nr:hypothetical protein PHMEG_00022695 [Phytophthora megakarya]